MKKLTSNFIVTWFTLILICFAILFVGCSEEGVKADLVLLNGKIVTMDEANSKVEALAITADSITALGSKAEIEEYIGELTEVIDLKGKLAIPGFIESHAHFKSLGSTQMKLDLTGADNWDEIIAMVVNEAERVGPGEWILGRGWHQEKWDPVPEPNVNRYPVHNVLSEAVPYNPVMLTHVSGHALFVNAKAMELAGINETTKDPRGGKIVRDENGNPIGVFEEEAENLIERVFNIYRSQKTPEQIKQDSVRAILLANEECLVNGITTFHDAGTSFEMIDLFKELIDSNKIGVRLYMMIYDNMKELKEKISDYRMIGYGDNQLTVRAIKKYVDGALGSRGAWLLAPYDDLTDHYGLSVTSLKKLRETAELAIENGIQLCIHSIGDRGNREVLNIYEKTFKSHPEQKDLRWRIEHAQHLSKNDLPRFAELGIIASMQGVHCTSDAVFVPARLGNYRAKTGAYVWRDLIDAGVTVCNGTDAPVEKVNPILNYYSTVTRKLEDGTEFYPEQKMTRMEALKSYTINGAYAAFEENIKGSLVPGKLADITVLSKDILTIPDEEILNTKVLYTIIGGKILYRALH
jgi:predicted amidohydrolase YtcJ